MPAPPRCAASSAPRPVSLCEALRAAPRPRRQVDASRPPPRDARSAVLPTLKQYADPARHHGAAPRPRCRRGASALRGPARCAAAAPPARRAARRTPARHVARRTLRRAARRACSCLRCNRTQAPRGAAPPYFPPHTSPGGTATLQARQEALLPPLQPYTGPARRRKTVTRRLRPSRQIGASLLRCAVLRAARRPRRQRGVSLPPRAPRVQLCCPRCNRMRGAAPPMKILPPSPVRRHAALQCRPGYGAAS